MLSILNIFSRRACLLGLFLPLSASQAFADGKMYIQLEEVSTTIPYQRAAIIFDEGKQTLILQSQYEIPNQPKDTSLAWIVPVPSVPEIASSDADMIERYPFLYLDIYTSPKLTSIRSILYVGCLLLWLALLFSIPILYGISRFYRRERITSFMERKNTLFCIILLGGFFFFFISMFFGAAAGDKGSNVEVIKAEKAGIHDVQVIKAESAGDLIEWLNENGFQSGPEDKNAIQDYIDRGWCFVASKIDHISDPKDSGKVSNHLLAPLILTFETPKPIYPTALTATGGHDTKILLYIATKTPYSTSAPIQLRGQRNQDSQIPYYEGTQEKPDSIIERMMTYSYLSKYKSTLTPLQMEKDIEFESSEVIPEFREHAIRW